MSWFLLTEESAIPGENPLVELKSTKTQPTYITVVVVEGMIDTTMQAWFLL